MNRSRRLPFVAFAAVLAAAGACDEAREASLQAGFEGLLADLEGRPVEQRQETVDAWIEALGGLPVVESEEAVFLARARDGVTPRVVGDFNAWGAEEPVAMSPVVGTDWHYLRLALDPAARIEYQLEYGDARGRDLLNSALVSSFGEERSVVTMPAFPRHPELEEAEVPAGRVESWTLESSILDNERQVHVYLPPGYDGSEEDYPSVYFGDGTAYIEEGGLPAILDRLISSGRVRPMVAVLVDPVRRREEYRRSETYRRMVVEELVPRVDRRYRTLPSAAQRAVIGGSRGALAAADLAFEHPEVFGLVGALSPALQPTDFAQDVAAAVRKPVRFFVLAAAYDREWVGDAYALRDALQARQYELTYVEVPIDHSIHAWRGHFDDTLIDLVPPPSG